MKMKIKNFKKILLYIVYTKKVRMVFITGYHLAIMLHTTVTMKTTNKWQQIYGNGR